jgi:CheY-like chemotaxis protein
MKILIVDDSATVRIQLKRDLSEFDHEIIEASDGNNALEKLDQHPDVRFVICDMNMPGINGITMAQLMRKKPGFDKIPIVMLTTESSPDIKARAKEVGITAWITKPYIADKLVAFISKFAK